MTHENFLNISTIIHDREYKIHLIVSLREEKSYNAFTKTDYLIITVHNVIYYYQVNIMCREINNQLQNEEIYQKKT